MVSGMAAGCWQCTLSGSKVRPIDHMAQRPRRTLMSKLKRGCAGLLIAVLTVVPTLGGAALPALAYTEDELAPITKPGSIQKPGH
jgi:hypothetical protein